MPRDLDTSLPDLTGRLAVVTGASDGIGQVIATRLARAGAELILPVRSAEKGAAAAERMRADAPGAAIATAPLDLSSLDSVAAFVAERVADGRPLDLLVNNAGVMQPPARQETRDGFELQFGTNHLGHFALTTGLLPLLRAAKGRVTHQTSVAARRGSINWDDPDWQSSYSGGRAYSQSKIAVALFARELDARSRAGGWGVSSTLAHPGISPTNLLAAQPGMGRDRVTIGLRVIRVMSRIGLVGTRDSAALPALLAATDPDAGGLFYGPRRTIGGAPVVQELWPPMRSTEDAARLWDLSARLVGPRFAIS